MQKGEYKMAGYNPTSMHSITFGDKNTWKDWHLIAKERPRFTPPAKHTNYVDVPGMSGSLDFSDLLTGYPTYQDREGEFVFYISNEYWSKEYSYVNLLNEIIEYLDQSSMRAVLEDDQDWFYVGKFNVSNYAPEYPWGEITISYKVSPYKWNHIDSVDDKWLWDPFSFINGVIQSGIYKDKLIPNDEWMEIKVDKKSTESSITICPDIIAQSDDPEQLIEMHFINSDLGIDITETIPNGQSINPYVIIKGNNCKLYFRHRGTISIVFRSGVL